MDTPRIYLVEDDVFYNRTLQYALWHSEFKNVKSFSNEEDFLRELNFQEPDMVILDYNLGVTTGLDLLRKIKARNKRTHVVLISATIKQDIVLRCIQLGAMAFIQKDRLTFSKLKVLGRKVAMEKKYISGNALAA